MKTYKTSYNTQNGCPFHYKGLECNSRKSRNTWSNRKIWPWSTEWSRAKANRVLLREHTGHSKHPLPTTQEKTLHMDITRWSTLKSDWSLYTHESKAWIWEIKNEYFILKRLNVLSITTWLEILVPNTWKYKVMTLLISINMVFMRKIKSPKDYWKRTSNF